MRRSERRDERGALRPCDQPRRSTTRWRAIPHVVLLGEDIANAGGTFAVTRGLLGKYGPDRVIDMPIAENAIAGMAVGLALGGFRPVIEIMFMDFMTLDDGRARQPGGQAAFHVRRAGRRCRWWCAPSMAAASTPARSIRNAWRHGSRISRA